MTQESEFSLFLRKQIEPPSTEDFLAFMTAIGQIAPPALTKVQLVSTLATILSNYCDPENEEEMDAVVQAAVDTVIGYEASVSLDLAVGPEDGVN